MKAALLKLAAVVAGMVVAFVLIIAVEMFSDIVHPLPADFGGTQAEMCQHVARYPQWVLAVVVPMWAVSAFAGTWIAARIGGLYSALFVGVLLFAGLVLNISMLPYPMWFKIADLLAIPAAVFVGIRLARRPKPADASAD
jgi:hypothetical protein